MEIPAHRQEAAPRRLPAACAIASAALHATAAIALLHAQPQKPRPAAPGIVVSLSFSDMQARGAAAGPALPDAAPVAAYAVQPVAEQEVVAARDADVENPAPAPPALQAVAPPPEPTPPMPAAPAPPAAASAPRMATARPAPHGAGPRHGAPAAGAAPAAPALPPAGQAEDGPVLIANPRFRAPPAPPAYPPRARDLGQEGEVLLQARLDPTGTPEEVIVQRSSGFDLLDRAAVAAVRRWAFEPGRRGDRPVAAWVQIPVRFALR